MEVRDTEWRGGAGGDGRTFGGAKSPTSLRFSLMLVFENKEHQQWAQVKAGMHLEVDISIYYFLCSFRKQMERCVFETLTSV